MRQIVFHQTANLHFLDPSHYFLTVDVDWHIEAHVSRIQINLVLLCVRLKLLRFRGVANDVAI